MDTEAPVVILTGTGLKSGSLLADLRSPTDGPVSD